eukprot:5321094-Prymnesium_polylepis.1
MRPACLAACAPCRTSPWRCRPSRRHSRLARPRAREGRARRRPSTLCTTCRRSEEARRPWRSWREGRSWADSESAAGCLWWCASTPGRGSRGSIQQPAGGCSEHSGCPTRSPTAPPLGARAGRVRREASHLLTSFATSECFAAL